MSGKLQGPPAGTAFDLTSVLMGPYAMQIASPTGLLYDPHLEEIRFWAERDREFGKLRFSGIPAAFLGTPGVIDALIGSSNIRVMS